MTRIDWEWIVLGAIVTAGLLRPRSALRCSQLTLGRESVMRRCPKCGAWYFADCINCTFRHGGTIPETEGPNGKDLVEAFGVNHKLFQQGLDPRYK